MYSFKKIQVFERKGFLPYKDSTHIIAVLNFLKQKNYSLLNDF